MSLIYLITLAVSTSMVAKTFGEYATVLLLEHVALPLPRTVLVNAFASAIIAGLTVLNVMGAAAVGKVENIIVGTKLLILLLLMLVGLSTLDVHRIQMEPMKPVMPVLGSVGLACIIFVLGAFTVSLWRSSPEALLFVAAFSARGRHP